MNNLAYTGHSPDQLIAVIEVRDQRIAVLETELASARNLYAAQEERYERGQKSEDAARERIKALEAEVAGLQSELSLVKCGEPNYPDRAYAMKNWLKTFGFKVFATLKHGEVGYVLSLLQAGDISRGKAAEAIAELLVGNEPPLPQLVDDMCGEDDLPREITNSLRAQVAELTAALHSAYNRCPQLVTDASNSGDNRPRAAIDAARKAGK